MPAPREVASTAECVNGNSTPAAAEQIYLNARIYTLSDTASATASATAPATAQWQSAMAVRDGEIVALGSNSDIRKLAGPDTTIEDMVSEDMVSEDMASKDMASKDMAIEDMASEDMASENMASEDMTGRMLMPGIQDMHVHPIDGGLKFKLECVFGSDLETAEVVATVRQCVASAPAGSWIQGGQWGTGRLEQDNAPTRQMLDAIVGDHPRFLMDWSVHNAWVNTRALGLPGITKTSPNPTGGEILRDEKSGEPTGILLDNAAYGARELIPGYSVEQRSQALAFSIGELLSHGVTSFRDAITTDANIKAYQRLAENNQLHARAKLSIPWKSAWSASHVEELKNIRSYRTLEDKYIDASFAKIMLDGVPPTYTSAVLEPYEPSDKYGSNHRGELMFAPEKLAEGVAFLDAQGLTIKIHATGDRALRVALDAVEHARSVNEPSTTQHEIAHTEMIDAADINRFAALNVAAEMSPILWYPSPTVEAMRVTIDERADFFWPTKSLLESGALVFYGSDWPAVVPDTNPWPGIESMVTRADPAGHSPGQLWPEQAIDLRSALRIVTINGAIAGKQSTSTGCLIPGKRADFIALDRNLFDVPITDISDTQVLRTFVDGIEVYNADKAQ